MPKSTPSSESQRECKLALALIVKNTDDEARYLAQCLSFVAQHVDGIFVTTTPKGEPVAPLIKKACESYDAHLSTFSWINDFAAARNYNFSQVPKDFTHILWLDADDGLRGAEKLKETISAHPNVDAFYLNYLYAFDDNKNPVVVHMKTQIVKNDGTFTWVGRLHEDFTANRDITRFFIKGIERIHLSTHEHFQSAKERNLEVALAQKADEPNDPRSYWNTGNSYNALNRNEEAIAEFDKFLEMSQSDDEKYIARLRRAECYFRIGDKKKSIEETQYAIGLKPLYPDAYHLQANFLMEMGNYEGAIEMYKLGLTRKPPYMEILVYNPRDYDYIPLMNLAKCYFNLHLPKQARIALEAAAKITPSDKNVKSLIRVMKKEEKTFDAVMEHVSKLKEIGDKDEIKKYLDSIPSKYQNHPAIVNIRNIHFVKTESSGRDVVFFCGYTSEEWGPWTAKTKGIGGSEEAVIWLSDLLSKRGWNVSVYANIGHKSRKVGKVMWHPFWSFNIRDKQDVLILWRSPKLADRELNATKVIVDLHDVIPSGEFTEERLKRIDHVFVKSRFHKTLFPNVPEEKFVVVPNGIDSKLFAGEHDKDQKLIINTSSGDRSLSAFVDIAERVKRTIPNAKFQWAYGWGVYDAAHANDQEALHWKATMIKRMKDIGIEELGRVSHSQVAEMYKKANILLYPSEFAEIDCISLTKAMAAGAMPVTTDFSAMGDKMGHGGYFFHSDKTKDNWGKTFEHGVKDEPTLQEMTRTVIELLKTPIGDRSEMRKWAMDNFDWQGVATTWHNILSQ